VVASAHGFHPIRNYLRKLRWDRNYRIRYALHHFLGAEVNDYNEACLQLFMLGAVKRIFEPGAKFDLMLVLTGGQGAGKSTFLRFLAVRDEWFSDDLKKLDDEKVYQRLAGHWIMEMSEMVATANAKSIEDIKSFLSRSKDTYKFPYDRYAADHLRQCVFAGTTNKMDFLPMDRSGNRRFLPVQVHPEQAETHILADEEASRAYIDLMWAEIMAIYESGEYSTHLSREMEEKQAREQEKYMQEDTRAGQIYGFMETYPGDKLCSKQLYKEALDHPYDEPKQWETREIFEIVNVGIANGSIQGWRPFANSRRFEKYGTQRGWERIPAEPEKESTAPVNQAVNQPVEKYEQMGFTAVEPGEDFPF
jgi:predicted P-loop ATPase